MIFFKFYKPPSCSYVMAGFLILGFMVERGMLTKWVRNRSPELIFVDYAAFSKLEPFVTVTGPTLAGNRPQTDQKLKFKV